MGSNCGIQAHTVGNQEGHPELPDGSNLLLQGNWHKRKLMKIDKVETANREMADVLQQESMKSFWI